MERIKNNFKYDKKLINLNLADLVVLTVIMFGFFIYTAFSQAMDPGHDLGSAVDFSSSDNWSAMVFQLVLLGLAFLYLRLRNFDFSQWKIDFNLGALGLALGVFILTGLVFNLYQVLVYQVFYGQTFILKDFLALAGESISYFGDKLSGADLSLILYALLNGFYEEIFFLGMCLSIRKDRIWLAFLYSLIVRYSFHVYQGQLSALGIGLVVGGTYYLIYRKMARPNLLPFFLAHALGDIFGLGIIF